MIKLLRILPLISLVFGLSGCSYTYDIKVFMLDGQIAFAPTDTDFWGNPDPGAFCSIDVRIEDGRPGTSLERDSAGMVQNSFYWRQNFAIYQCQNEFPIKYGDPVEGEPSSITRYNTVARPLLRGMIYEVRTTSAGGYGSGAFMIEGDGTLRSLGRI